MREARRQPTNRIYEDVLSFVAARRDDARAARREDYGGRGGAARLNTCCA